MALAARGASAPGALPDYKIWQVILAAAVGRSRTSLFVTSVKR